MKTILITAFALSVLAILGLHRRRRYRQNVLLTLMAEEESELKECHDKLQRLKEATCYLRKSDSRDLRDRLNKLRSLTLPKEALPSDDNSFVPVINCLQEFLHDTETFRIELNERFIEAETLRWRSFFAGIEKHPLTTGQSRAVVTDEKNNLIVAGAGSGKTSTIIARAAYLLKKKKASENEMLLLAFGRNAADVLRERIKQRTGYSVNVKTFHALGLEIINTVNKDSRLGVLPDDRNQTKRKRLIQRAIEEASLRPKTLSLLITFFSNYLQVFEDEFSFQDEGEYKEYLKHNDLRSLNGDPVKSLGECRIANHLFRNGVPYKYEARYPINAGIDVRRAYQPDFTVERPQTEGSSHVYIEYWGINKHGQTKPRVNQRKYKLGMRWKRGTHAKYGTSLIELSYGDMQNGLLEQKLEKQLRDHDIPFQPINDDELFKQIANENRISELVALISPILGYMRAVNCSPADLRCRAEEQFSGFGRLRADAFLDILQPISSAYAEVLKKEGFVDYDEMIGRAADYVQLRKYTSRFKHILVDEFQDISKARANLLLALRDQRDDSTVFCVGDDWQSIFRFSGSDISLFTGFEKEFGDAATSRLEQTFRFNNKIATVSGAFVMRNPNQLRKSLKPCATVHEPKVFVVRHAESGVDISKIESVLSILNGDAAEHQKTVYIIGRYTIGRKSNLKRFLQTHRFSNLEVQYKTAHSAKGDEADHVIIIDLEAGRYGFPNELVDDPLLDLIRSIPEQFPHAEERRLFYVALTRARESVYLIVPQENQSEFTRELSDPSAGYDVSFLGDSDASEEDLCPVCNRGHLVNWQGKSDVEPHKQCSLYPYCDYKSLEYCHVPYCGGHMRKVRGRYGEFWGCTNWRADGSGCRNTKKAPPS